jgi:hypothetical protein
MLRRDGGLRRVLVAAITAMSVAALSASISVAATKSAACTVHNLNHGIDHASLQRAVRAAEPGDALLVQGICSGTTLIDKELDISFMGWAGAPMPLGPGYVVDPDSRVVSDGTRPALVIDPGVEHFSINPGLQVAGGIVIDDLANWRGDAPLPSSWRTATPTTIASTPSASLRDCHLRNDATGDEFSAGQQAMDAAGSGDPLSLRGLCDGATVIDQAARVAGWRIAISSAGLDGQTTGADDSGPPTLAHVSVDDGVDSLVLRDVRVSDGFDISDHAAS